MRHAVLRSGFVVVVGGVVMLCAGGVAAAQPTADADLVVQANVTTRRGSLAEHQLESPFDGSPTVGACFAAADGVDTAKLALTVRRNGSVSSAKATTVGRRRDRAFERCVAAAARAITFDPGPRSTTATLSLILVRPESVSGFLDSVDRDPGADAVPLTAPAAPRSVDMINAKIQRDYSPGIRHCYNAARKRDDTLRGSVSVTIDIAADGAVTKATVTGMAAVKSCIERLAARWQFGPLDTGTAVTVAFGLAP
jgi:hypothetical protein